MQIILQEDVEKLGTRGQIVEVAAGYARNYLLPRKLGIEATASSLKRLEKIRATLAKRTATEREAAQKQAEALAAVALRLRARPAKATSSSARLPRPTLPKDLPSRAFSWISARFSSPSPSRSSGNTR